MDSQTNIINNCKNNTFYNQSENCQHKTDRININKKLKHQHTNQLAHTIFFYKQNINLQFIYRRVLVSFLLLIMDTKIALTHITNIREMYGIFHLPIPLNIFYLICPSTKLIKGKGTKRLAATYHSILEQNNKIYLRHIHLNFERSPTTK